MRKDLLLHPVAGPAGLAAQPPEAGQDAPTRLRLRSFRQIKQQADQLVPCLGVLKTQDSNIYKKNTKEKFLSKAFFHN